MATKSDKKKTDKTEAPKGKKAPAKTAAKSAAKPAAKKAPKETAAPTARGPLARLKALHGSKDELVKKLVEPLAGETEDTDALGERLKKASNQQLLRLAKVVEAVKAKYGSRSKLIASLGATLGKAKDNDYLAKLGTLSLPKLWDMARTLERRARA